MKKNDDGFTLMETLLSVAIVLIVSSLLVIASATAIKGSSQAIRAAVTAATFTRIDRFIRAKTDAVHIPYWADPAPYINALTGELYQSKIGQYIKSSRPVTNYQNIPRAIEVVYMVHNREMRTVALLPSIPIMDNER